MATPRDPGTPTPTAQARAVAALRAAILEGGLRPGQRVNQEEWAERVGVSLIPIREALGALAGEGLVTYRPRRGYAVTELDLGELEEISRIRRLLETDAPARHGRRRREAP
jgi:DNA-binding GntR family transcriptional regulator